MRTKEQRRRSHLERNRSTWSKCEHGEDRGGVGGKGGKEGQGEGYRDGGGEVVEGTKE